MHILAPRNLTYIDEGFKNSAVKNERKSCTDAICVSVFCTSRDRDSSSSAVYRAGATKR